MDLRNRTIHARVVLLGLEEGLAAELGSVLKSQEHTVIAEPYHQPSECPRLLRKVGADIVFCPAERGRYLALLKALERDSEAPPPVIVVSRTPEVADWLDAMEAGASDYCTAPFEPTHIAWILQSNVRQEPGTVLHRTAG
ncbi:MAG TPA: response regulator [Bryobacteraceae bacterium]|nr:response regulator [Bryobacteraceae bacterium]